MSKSDEVSTKEMLIWVVGILGALLALSYFMKACTNIQYKNADTARQAKLACIHEGGAWASGECIYSKVAGR